MSAGAPPRPGAPAGGAAAFTIGRVPSAIAETGRPPAARGATPSPATVAGDERLARIELRRQIASLERRLGALFGSAFPRGGLDWNVGGAGGPRVLGIADLERVRDALAVRLREAEVELGRRAEAEERSRVLIERMIAAPDRHRWVIVSNEDIGERGCRHWHSRPRWGILGMLLGWWRVRLSSGCPLAVGVTAPAPVPELMARARRRASGAAPDRAERRSRRRDRHRRPSRARSTTSARPLPGARSPWSRSWSRSGS